MKFLNKELAYITKIILDNTSLTCWQMKEIFIKHMNVILSTVLSQHCSDVQENGWFVGEDLLFNAHNWSVH